MFIPDDEKDDRKAALQKLMGMMSKSTGDKLGALKGKPVAASMTIEKMDPHAIDDDEDKLGTDMDEPDDDDMGSDDEMSEHEPSPEEKAMISKLYHKYC